MNTVQAQVAAVVPAVSSIDDADTTLFFTATDQMGLTADLRIAL